MTCKYLNNNSIIVLNFYSTKKNIKKKHFLHWKAENNQTNQFSSIFTH